MDRGFNNFSNPASVSGGRPFGGYQMPQSNPSITHQGVGSSHVPVIKNYNNMNKELQKSLENAARVEKELSRQNPGAQLQQIYGNENVISGDLNPVTDHIKQVVNWNQKLSRKNLKHAKVIDLSYKSLDGNLDEFCKVMDCSDFDLSLLSFSSTSLNDKNLEDVIEAVRGGKGVYYNNPPNGERHLCSGAVFGERQFKLSPDDPFFLQQKITYLNLSNCNLTDASADMIASSLTYGHFHNHPIQARYLTNTKVIDVSDNNITAKGEECFYTAFDKMGNHRDLAVILHSYRSYEPSGQKDKILPKITNFLGKAKEYYLKIGKDALDKKILEHEELYGWTGIHKIAADPNKPKWYFCDKTKDNVSWEANCAIVKCAPSLFIGGLPKYFQCVSLDTSSGFIHKETLGCFVEVFDNLRDNSIKETSIQETELAGGSCDIF